jgi:hypothetical protein
VVPHAESKAIATTASVAVRTNPITKHILIRSKKPEREDRPRVVAETPPDAMPGGDQSVE